MKKKKKNELEIDPEERKTQDMSVVAEYSGEKSNSAKFVEAIGDDYVDIPVKDNSFGGRIKNFWYHYKWPTVFAGIIAVILIVGIHQFVTVKSEKTDLSVMYAGPELISAGQEEEIKSAFGEILSVDINNDGKKSVFFYNCRYLNKAQVRSVREQAALNGVADGINDQDNATAYEQINNLIFLGECGVMFLDYTIYEDLKNAGGLETFENVLGYIPDKAIDEYGIRICDTKAYEYYTALQEIPADTVVCMRTLSTAGGVFSSEKTAKNDHDAAAIFFSDFMGFEFPEGAAAD